MQGIRSDVVDVTSVLPVRFLFVISVTFRERLNP